MTLGSFGELRNVRFSVLISKAAPAMIRCAAGPRTAFIFTSLKVRNPSVERLPQSDFLEQGRKSYPSIFAERTGRGITDAELLFTVLQPADHGLCSIAHPKLGEYLVLDFFQNRTAQVQFVFDLFVEQSLRDTIHYLLLPAR